MSEWQPIETAPKDGTHILLTDGEFVVAGYWGHYWSPVQEKLPGMWLQHGDGGTAGSHPTHWQPLPEPPKPEAT